VSHTTEATQATEATEATEATQATEATDPVAVVARFDKAFNDHDVDAVMALMSEDCVFEGTAPPDGHRFVGAAAVRAAWVALFAAAPDARFTTEEVVACGDRVIVRWRYDWGPGDGGAASGHVRGVDVFRVRGGLVVEKLAYVKG
jgi:ketosteroid isomerase-like protein